MQFFKALGEIKMTFYNVRMVEKFKDFFNLKESPIAFFYTDDPPQEVYKPKAKDLKHLPCIIQLLNGVRRGRTLVLGKDSRNLCPGGLAYLGFRKIMSGIEYYLSIGISDNDGKIVLEGEKFKKNPELAKGLYENIPFRKSPAKFAVFTPLNKLNDETNKRLLVIFYVNMDQLAGLMQLVNYDLKEKGATLGMGSSCSTIITEPFAELDKKSPRAFVGMLTDVLSRSHVGTNEATFTIGYDRLMQLYKNIEGSFLELDAWKKIRDRIK